MTPIADMVRKLLEAGATPEVIVLAVSTAEENAQLSGTNAGQIRDNEQRAYERERKREYRLRVRQLSRDNPNNPNNSTTPRRDLSRDASVNALSLREDSKKLKKEVATGRTIPPDWHPAEKHYTEGDQLGIPRQRVDQHAADMRLWAEANRNRAVARKADWDLTFSGWLRRNSQAQSALSDSPKMTIAEYHAKYSNGGKPNGEDHKTAIDRGGIESPDHASKLFPPR